MVKLLKRAGKHTGRYLVLATMTATLVACGGGGSGDTVPIDEQDLDGDGTPNGEDLDDDGDGDNDDVDRFTDRDGDGFDDDVAAAVADLDNDNDGILNKNDTDADGDDLEDVSLDGSLIDPSVDLNGDGFDDRDGSPIVSFVTPSASAPCGSEPNGIANGSNPSWGDNCWVRAKQAGTTQGQFANSLYTVGIQRIAYCFAGSPAAGASYTNFADGLFGNNTEAALIAFQESVNTPENPIDADGEVGDDTWLALQGAITQIGQVPIDATGVGMHIYGVVYDDSVADKRCENIPLFYQDITISGTDIVRGGWHLAKDNATLPADGVTPVRVPFSISSDIGQRK